jgi:hypothetical protein
MTPEPILAPVQAGAVGCVLTCSLGRKRKANHSHAIFGLLPVDAASTVASSFGALLAHSRAAFILVRVTILKHAA